eukprot:7463443-Pyramimonas_sp.AAC.1
MPIAATPRASAASWILTMRLPGSKVQIRCSRERHPTFSFLEQGSRKSKSSSTTLSSQAPTLVSFSSSAEPERRPQQRVWGPLAATGGTRWSA